MEPIEQRATAVDEPSIRGRLIAPLSRFGARFLVVTAVLAAAGALTPLLEIDDSWSALASAYADDGDDDKGGRDDGRDDRDDGRDDREDDGGDDDDDD